MGLLEGHMSHCGSYQKIIISRDRGSCEHRANNSDGNAVRQFKIDGDVIFDESERCDWLVLNDDSQTAYFIELKGTDIKKAIRQVETTYGILKPEIRSYQVFYRIIYRTGSHDIRSKDTIKWKEKCGKDKKTGKSIAILRNQYYEEDI